jgi:Helix-turn-helix domain
MATLTIVEAARVTGVSRSQLYRYIRAGKLSRTPDGLLDTVELLRAGLPLRVPSVPLTVPLTVPETHDATETAVSPVPEPVPRVPSTDTATLERLIDVLQRELGAARERETLLAQRLHERETQLTQMAHERETQLLHLMAQMHQRYDRLLDTPRPPPPLSPQDATGATQDRRGTQRTPLHPRPPQETPAAVRGEARRRTRQTPPAGAAPAVHDQVPAFDTRKFSLGQLCPRGHDYAGTGQTLRRLPRHVCPACDAEQARERREAKRHARPPSP